MGELEDVAIKAMFFWFFSYFNVRNKIVERFNNNWAMTWQLTNKQQTSVLNKQASL